MRQANHDPWERILTPETMTEISKLTKDDFQELDKFYAHVREHINVKTVVIAATRWHSYPESKQVNIAIHLAGQLQASRFIALMDHMSTRFLKGELK